MRSNTLFDGLPVLDPGAVWLVGAGPGDPGLLTLHALNGLAQADVVVHDALVDPGCLALARPGADIVHAGKRGGRPSPKQPDISARLVREAKAGKRVIRLKGGDPFLFGRGGEEALALVRAGVPFRIVPGITAGIGGLAYAGIPATDRNVNSVVAFITGHDATGAVPGGIDWAALAKGAPVIVLYMAIKTLPEISARLIAAGRASDEPVALVSNAATACQSVIETTLGGAAEAGQAAPAPAVIVIGDVVRLRAGLDWLGALELGRKLDGDPLGIAPEIRDVG
ncbi:MAG: uroporphyrinogen-III C-methyltransferase [Alphaproteobacteria bacterium]|nr:uroporphyrinogen-III C-methyltransferase [Alphaproteobacteria bacterium]